MKLIRMKMCSFLLIFISGFATKTIHAQVINNGSTIAITSGAEVYAQESFTNNENGIVINDGSITVDSNFINNTNATVSGDGIYNVQQDFKSTGTFNQDNSLINFFGSASSVLQNTTGVVYKLQISKTANRLLALSNNQKILKNLNFLNDKNWIKLNSKILTIGGNCTITGYSENRFIITNGTGSLKKLNLGTNQFTFPVGFDKSTYNSLSITENGTVDNYSVRCLEHALLQGSTGNAISTKGIDASWVVSETTSGGANAIIQANWKTTDELPTFDYTKCMVVRYNGTAWDYNANKAGTATGSTYRAISRNGITSLGYFTVLSGKTPSFAGNIFTNENDDAAISSNSNAVLFKVYPTIVQNNLNIDVSALNKSMQKMNINIVDVNGHVVWQKQNAAFQSQKILLPNLTAGVYNVLITYDGINKFTQKIIVSK